jgi:hypothetical protein
MLRRNEQAPGIFRMLAVTAFLLSASAAPFGCGKAEAVLSEHSLCVTLNLACQSQIEYSCTVEPAAETHCQ